MSGLELVTAGGELLILSRERDGDSFHGAVVNLGAIGIVTKVTLDVQPTYKVAQVVYENLSMMNWNTTWTKFLPVATA